MQDWKHNFTLDADDSRYPFDKPSCKIFVYLKLSLLLHVESYQDGAFGENIRYIDMSRLLKRLLASK